MPPELNWIRVCASIEDHLVPRLRLSPCERALYYHLLRHSRLLGRRSLHVSKTALARSSCLSENTVLARLRTLARKSCVKIVERSFRGHFVEVLTPAEVLSVCRQAASEGRPTEVLTTLKSRKLRAAIFKRDRHICFYCLRPLGPRFSTLDHIEPLCSGGEHLPHNLVACCFDCNSRKHLLSATDFLRVLRRERRFTRQEFRARLKALRSIQVRHSKPLAEQGSTGNGGRPGRHPQRRGRRILWRI